MDLLKNQVAAIGLVAGCLFGSTPAFASIQTLLSGNLTADNEFYAYISTDDSIQGTQIAYGNNWGATFNFNNIVLESGQNYFLHIKAIDWGRPEGFIGTFNLSNSDFEFSNNSQQLSTNTVNWTASPSSSSWSTPTGVPVSSGLNGIGPWGSRTNIASDAEWIWSNPYNGTVFLSTQISSLTSVPVPPAFVLFASGMLGFCFSRKKDRA